MLSSYLHFAQIKNNSLILFSAVRKRFSAVKLCSSPVDVVVQVKVNYRLSFMAGVKDQHLVQNTMVDLLLHQHRLLATDLNCSNPSLLTEAKRNNEIEIR